MLIELSFETSDTSVITRRLIRPSVSTTGVKLSEMPNFLKLIVARTVRQSPRPSFGRSRRSESEIRRRR